MNYNEVRDDLVFKTSELDYDLKIIYDRSGGMTIIKQERTVYDSSKYTEIYLPRDAMFAFALKLLKKEGGGL